MSEDFEMDMGMEMGVKMPKKIIWKTKQDFPFMDGSNNLFTFLIRPYLDDRTLGILAGTCRSVREYVTKDLESYWFGKYLELYERGVIEKYVRSEPCTPHCCDALYNLRDIYNYWNQKFTDPKVYQDNNIWWDDLPCEVGSEIKKQRNRSRYFRRTGFKYEGKIVCCDHYVPKYYNTEHYGNKAKKRKHIDYYSKVMLYKLLKVNKQTRNNQIDKLESQYKDHERSMKQISDKLEKLKAERDFIQSLK
jgi:hypothetical protein